MSFLQPLLLAALPLISLPIIIHLINQRRYQTMPWGAMLFLLAANRMSRGYARLRQWLILAFRTLAVAALILAVARPLAGGWAGSIFGGRPDTTIVLLDRSASMRQLGEGTSLSKLESGRRQLAATLRTLGSSRWVLIDSRNLAPRELESPAALLEAADLGPTSAAADLPAMLDSAAAYIDANQTGRTEIWICSDLRESDWTPQSGRWRGLRDRFLQFTQSVRLHLLAYSQAPLANLAVEVVDVRLQENDGARELLVSLEVRREAAAAETARVPLEFEIDGARSVLEIEFAGPRYELRNHRIPLVGQRTRGWGSVSIPADSQPADNESYFVFDQPPPRRTVVVAEDPLAARPLELAAAISSDRQVTCVAEVLTRGQLSAVDWDQTAMVLWQGELPDDGEMEFLEPFAERGGRLIFFPPRNPSQRERFGVRWTTWRDDPTSGPVAVDTWRADQDLLANTMSGAALPVGRLQVANHCGLDGEATSLATLAGGGVLLARAATDRGGVYFCATTPAPQDSTLAAEGVVLYALTQRALSAGAGMLGTTRQLAAGPPPGELPAQWAQVAGPPETLSVDYPYQAGVYQTDEQLLAVNVPPAEAELPTVSDEQLADLFGGLDWVRVEDQAGGLNALVQEVWRIFLIGMILAMIVEACLCLPKPRSAEGAGR